MMTYDEYDNEDKYDDDYDDKMSGAKALAALSDIWSIR